MRKLRTIRRIISARKVNMGGIFLDQPLPVDGLDQIDPFLLLHHWEQSHTGGRKQKDLGVGPHPHRGFAPVTFIFKGGVHHRDSRGNNSIIEAGGTQWMNSGMGIVHSERPTREIANRGGDFEIIQFWVNTPAKYKMKPPSYHPLTAKETPMAECADPKIKIAIVAGEFNGVAGKIEASIPILALRLNIKKGGTVNLPIPENFNAFLYQLDGSLEINEHQISSKKELTWFNNDGKRVQIKGLEDTRAILLAAEPINEEVTAYGPFVMNTQSEIMEAMRDYQMGKMGILIEEFE